MVDINQTKPNLVYLIYMYKEDLVFNNQQWLICHETKSNLNKTSITNTNPQKNIGTALNNINAFSFTIYMFKSQ